MPRTVADRICIRLHAAAEFDLARCRRLAGIVSGIIASRSGKLHDIVHNSKARPILCPSTGGDNCFSGR